MRVHWQKLIWKLFALCHIKVLNKTTGINQTGLNRDLSRFINGKVSQGEKLITKVILPTFISLNVFSSVATLLEFTLKIGQSLWEKKVSWSSRKVFAQTGTLAWAKGQRNIYFSIQENLLGKVQDSFDIFYRKRMAYHLG